MTITKQELRRSIAKKKQLYTNKELLQYAILIQERIVKEPLFNTAKTVLLYYALPDEVQTDTFIEQWGDKKQLLLPTVIGDHLILKRYQGKSSLKKGAYNIWEPIGLPFNDLSKIDLVLVPGVAFDYNKNRLGRGKGYYDRLLKNLTCPFWGIAYDFQLLEAIPSEIHDIKMDKIITSRQCL